MKSQDIINISTDVEGAISLRLEHARREHPHFAMGKYEALGVILAEVDELIHAVEHESEIRAKNEALDVIATCVRFLEDDHHDRS